MGEAAPPQGTGEAQRPRLPSNVIALGAVSLLMDASTEMVRPIFPLLLRALGAQAWMIGLIVGLADTVSSLLKLAAGWLSDRLGKRKALIALGYGASALAKPVIALAATPWQVLFAWVFDRSGKGVRGAPRDAVIADSTPESIRGRAYGLHRAMDSAGAALGPLMAMGLLWAAMRYGWSDLLAYRRVFWLAAIPGVLSVVVVLVFVRERNARPKEAGARKTGRPALGRRFFGLMVVLGLFSLGNSADEFLMLRAKDLGMTALWISGLYVAMNVIYSATSHWFGALSDRVGRRPLVMGGFLVYAAVYVGFAEASHKVLLWPLFCIYGIYYAMADGAVRALVSDLVSPAARGTAFGIHQFVTGILLLPASVVMGWLYGRYQGRAFYVGAALALVAAAGLLIVLPSAGGPANAVGNAERGA
jgi:MFS family permease